MIARFRGHRQEFLKLLDMAKADAAVITILAGDVLVTNTKTVDLSDSSAVTNQDQLPADRLAAYLHLMNAAGIHGLLKGRDVVEFRIEPASESIGDHKGIFFSTEPMKTCAAELEKCMPPRPEKFAFKLIEPDWYIYLATP